MHNAVNLVEIWRLHGKKVQTASITYPEIRLTSKGAKIRNQYNQVPNLTKSHLKTEVFCFVFNVYSEEKV